MAKILPNYGCEWCGSSRHESGDCPLQAKLIRIEETGVIQPDDFDLVLSESQLMRLLQTKSDYLASG